MPAPSSPPILGLSLRSDQRAPRLARRALEDALDSAFVVEDARLLATELVNDAVLNCASDDIIRVAVHLDDGFLVISVHRPIAPPSAEPIRRAAAAEAGGLGLRVVQQVADRWGTEGPDGHRMWAALALRAP